MIFEILILDSVSDSNIKDETNLLYSLISNWWIWIKPKIQNGKIHDNKLWLTVSIKQINHEENDDISIKKTFIVKVQGDFDNLEKIRITLLKHIKNINFDKTYILNDDVSSKIWCDIYPRINLIENLLRKYIVKFLVTKLWPKWWEQTADSEMKKKSNLRKNNETVFSDFIDNDIYKIDFWELWKIIYLQSSWYISKDDIISKVLNLNEDSQSIIKLKKELKSNYTKFFKENFKDNNFQEKWEKLERLRNKVAHNNLFTKDDLNDALLTTDALEEIISSANNSIDEIQFDLNDKDAIRESINSNIEPLEDINREIILEKLEESEKWAIKWGKWWFVSLKHFVVNHLWSQWYHYWSSNKVIDDLIEEWIVEKYEHKPEDDSFNPVLAIRIKK